MCMCSPQFSHILGVDEESKKKFQEKLPFLIQQRQKIQKTQMKQLINWQAESALKKADLIFYNGTIYTMEDLAPICEAVSIINDRILEVGSQEAILKHKGPNTKVIDLNGKVLLPGFIDPHIHMAFSSMKHWVELSPFLFKNMEEVYKKIVQTVQETNEGSWALFQLFDPMITNGFIDVSKVGLDKISNSKAIVILQSNGHVAHVNSYALKLAGVTKQTQDPPHGRFIRDYGGELTGEVQQQTALQYFTKIIPKISGDEYINNFEKLLSHASSKGCTSLHDCGIGLLGPQTDLCTLYETFKDETPIRYSGYLISTLWQTWMKLNLKPDFKDTELRINGIKCWVDGSTQAGSAFLHDPYIKPEWGNGFSNYKQDVLNKAVLEAHKKGFQVGIHANGDAAIDMALMAFDNANKAQKKAHLRHRIQHSTICHYEQLLKMKQLSLSPSFLIGHVYFYGGVFRDKILGYQRSKLVDPMKSSISVGLIPSIHSDYNCQPIDPLRCIYNAVTRMVRETKQVLNQNQCVTPYEAVKAMTINAAWQCHMEDIVGSLKKGKFADFVILDKDPMKIPGQQIINIKIWQTWKGGQKWYQG